MGVKVTAIQITPEQSAALVAASKTIMKTKLVGGDVVLSSRTGRIVIPEAELARVAKSLTQCSHKFIEKWPQSTGESYYDAVLTPYFACEYCGVLAE